MAETATQEEHELLTLLQLRRSEKHESGFKCTFESPLGEYELADEGMFLEHQKPSKFPLDHPIRKPNVLPRAWRTEYIGNGSKEITKYEANTGTAVHCWNKLPDDLIEKIFSAMQSAKELGTVAQVCRRFYHLSRSSELWMEAYKRDWAWPPTPSPSYNLAEAGDKIGRKWRAAAANALRGEVAARCVQANPRSSYIHAWKRLTALVREEELLRMRRVARQKQYWAETLYTFVHGSVLSWLAFHLLAAFSIVLPLYIDGVIPVDSWTAVFSPLFAAFGCILLFMVGDVWASLRRMNRRVLGRFSGHRSTYVLMLVPTVGVAMFVFAVIYINATSPFPGKWCLGFVPLMVLLAGAMVYLTTQIPLTAKPTRTIVGLWLGVSALLLTVAVLIPLRLDGFITRPWGEVLIPLWIMDILLPVTSLVYFFVYRKLLQSRVAYKVFSLFSISGWLNIVMTVTEALISVKADGYNISLTLAFIPIYFFFLMVSQPLNGMLFVGVKELCQKRPV